MEQFKSTHNLDFETAIGVGFDTSRFRVGTCEGLYSCSDGCFNIIAIENNAKGNGHLQDVFDWFENSCKRDGYKLRVLELWNKKFMNHLISKRGFYKIDADNVEKVIL